jgi:hypothetical protein
LRISRSWRSTLLFVAQARADGLARRCSAPPDAHRGRPRPGDARRRASAPSIRARL